MMRWIKVKPSGWTFIICLFVLSGLSACSSNATTDHSALTDTEWRLSSVIENNETLSLTDDHPVFSLRLQSDGAANGQVACNRWNGRYQLGHDTLAISNTASTRARCHYAEDAMRSLGSRYLDGLQSASGFEVNDDELVLEITAEETWIFRPL